MRICCSSLACAALAVGGCAGLAPPAETAPAVGEAASPDAPLPSPAPGPGPAADAGRVPVAPAGSAHHDRVEGTSFRDACQDDGGCFVGGCSNEVCSAEQGVSSTCEMPVDGWGVEGASCGCVQGLCVWYRAAGESGSGGAAAPDGGGGGLGEKGASGAAAPGEGRGPLPRQGQTCTDDDRCASGLTCVRYLGAGGSGPELRSCEIRCGAGGTCPVGLSCTTIAGGLGEVCWPSSR